MTAVGFFWAWSIGFMAGAFVTLAGIALRQSLPSPEQLADAKRNRGTGT